MSATPSPGSSGLGDYVEKYLQKWGITPDRYVEVKQALGFPPTCDCEGRKEWLDRAGEWIARQWQR